MKTYLKLLTLTVFSAILAGACCASAQVAPAQDRLQFDVASVRQSESVDMESNVPLGPGDVYNPTGGVLRARNYTLLTYLVFAYKLTDFQQEAIEAAAPSWVLSERFSIEASTDKHDATKDQMREMMRSLLAERFKLAAHYESRQVRVLALVPVKTGQVGLRLQLHPEAVACEARARKPAKSDSEPSQPLQPAKGGYPSICGGVLGLPASAQDRYSFGAANVPMSLIASALSSWGNLGLPVVDQTQLAGNYDFVLEFTPEPRPAYAAVDSGGPGFQEALKQQLGLKLEARKAPVPFLVLDHVEHPTEN